MKHTQGKKSFLFISSLTVLLVMVISLLTLPMDVHAFGSLSENGTAAFMGIGITPTKILHVSGTGQGSVPLFSRGSDSAGFIIERTPTNRWVLGVNESPTLGNGFVLSTIPTGNTSIPRLMITQDGKVGIGTINPNEGRLHVDGNTGSAIYGSSTINYGVRGYSGSGTGVYGKNTGNNNFGYLGDSNYGVYGQSSNLNYGCLGNNSYGAYGYGGAGNYGYLGSGQYGVYGESPGGYAGYFIGNVIASGKVGIGGTSAPSSKLQVAGAIATAFTTKTDNYTATLNESIIAVDLSSALANKCITLPSAVGIDGRTYTIKKVDGSERTVTIVGTSAQPIDGQPAGYRLYNQWDYVTVVSNGSGWLIVAEKPQSPAPVL